MKISYAIPVCNEHDELKSLLNFLIEYKDEEDEIVVLLDEFNHSKQISDLLSEYNDIKVYKHALNNNFAAHKNYLNSCCTGDFIFQIDADETTSKFFILNLKWLLKQNPQIDLYIISRINIVEGITQFHLDKWNWTQNEKGWINFPDSQKRLYRNTKSGQIHWDGKVHETIKGYRTYTHFPQNEEWCLKHIKQINKQEQQNKFYETI